jgi:hypothetical protein
MKRTLYAFPDSGHQILFFPLRHLTPADLPQDDDWRSPVGKLWLKGRFGVKSIATEAGQKLDTAGLWIAVDLNVGNLDRGYVVPERHKRAARRRRLAEKSARPVINGLAAMGEGQATTGGYTSYIARTEADLPGAITVDLSLEFNIAKLAPGCVLEIVFIEEAGDPIPVNLIVDFGNSRTVVLALEQKKGADGLASICRPILFPKSGWDADDLDFDVTDFDAAIPDSWFAIVEGTFKTQPSRPVTAAVRPEFMRQNFLQRVLNTAKMKRADTVMMAPHQFCEVSPAVIGSAARDALSELDTRDGGLSFLSSPKRYVWDDTPLGSAGKPHWTMHAQAWRKGDGGPGALMPLKGDILRFMPNAAAKWSLNSWPFLEAGDVEMRADHSRADSLIWVALAILEQAYRQIQSESWRRGNQPYLRRELGDILLTYPAGWTEAEIEVFRQKWEIARDIFIVSRTEDPAKYLADGRVPKVRLALDEAVAPQLAIVYAEIHHMRDYGENWIELFGHGKGAHAAVRVMTIDIGGGTTDTSIVEYTDNLPGAGVDLTAKLVFKDSTTIAGDRLVKDILERLLLPALGSRFADDEAAREAFSSLFYRRARRDSERAQWSVITRTVLIPIAQQWLRASSLGDVINPDTGQAWTALESGASRTQLARLNALGAEAGLGEAILPENMPLQFDLDALRKVIHDWFIHIADTHARYLSVFDCDLVILTGKPSELPEIRTLIERRLPIDPGRILSARNYYAGDWMPMSKKGNIDDAKLVTALGTAVYNAVEASILPGWRIRGEVDDSYRVENHWGRIAGSLKPFSRKDVILEAGDMHATARLLTDSFIGRARFLNQVLPEQVYQLVMKSGAQVLVDAKFKRVMTEQQGRRYEMSAEGLVLISAIDVQTGKPIARDAIELRLCTLPRAEEYWQDTGRFEVRWSA